MRVPGRLSPRPGNDDEDADLTRGRCGSSGGKLVKPETGKAGNLHPNAFPCVTFPRRAPLNSV